MFFSMSFLVISFMSYMSPKMIDMYDGLKLSDIFFAICIILMQ